MIADVSAVSQQYKIQNIYYIAVQIAFVKNKVCVFCFVFWPNDAYQNNQNNQSGLLD